MRDMRGILKVGLIKRIRNYGEAMKVLDKNNKEIGVLVRIGKQYLFFARNDPFYKEKISILPESIRKDVEESIRKLLQK